MRNYSYEIKYINDGEQTSEFEYSKFSAIARYMEIITSKNFDISNLAILRNGTDITSQVNRFLYK